MNLATIKMPRSKAREKFLEYRKSVRERHNAEEEQIMRGYRELANGRQLISLAETIRAGGLVERIEKRYDYEQKGQVLVTVRLPALACCRAHLGECWVATNVGISKSGEAVFSPDPYYRGLRDRIAVSGFEGLVYSHGDYRAMVPLVPPALRPVHHLRNYYVLWEADWEKARPPHPPRDPALLKRIGGDLFAVLAVWDLSELERAVLAGRRSESRR